MYKDIKGNERIIFTKYGIIYKRKTHINHPKTVILKKNQVCKKVDKNLNLLCIYKNKNTMLYFMSGRFYRLNLISFLFPDSFSYKKAQRKNNPRNLILQKKLSW